MDYLLPHAYEYLPKIFLGKNFFRFYGKEGQKIFGVKDSNDGSKIPYPLQFSLTARLILNTIPSKPRLGVNATNL
jgi:hypothetical protein